VSVIYVVLPLAVLLAAAFVAAYTWATRSGQMDDLVTPALRVLAEDEEGDAGDDEGGGTEDERDEEE